MANGEYTAPFTPTASANDTSELVE